MKLVICVDVDVHILQLPGPHMEQQYLHTRSSSRTPVGITKNSDLLFKVPHQILTVLWFCIVFGSRAHLGNCGPGFSSIFYNSILV